jgi:hypothetical protein
MWVFMSKSWDLSLVISIKSSSVSGDMTDPIGCLNTKISWQRKRMHGLWLIVEILRSETLLELLRNSKVRNSSRVASKF